MYATLARRSCDLGDIINVNGDWGLPEWYGQKPKAKKRAGSEKVGEKGTPSINPKDFLSELEDADSGQIEPPVDDVAI